MCRYKLEPLALTGESFSPGVSSVKKLRPPPAPELCRAVDVLDLAASIHTFHGGRTDIHQAYSIRYGANAASYVYSPGTQSVRMLHWRIILCKITYVRLFFFLEYGDRKSEAVQV